MTNLPTSAVTPDITNAVYDTLTDHPDLWPFVANCLRRHRAGDWGDIAPDDIERNNAAKAIGLPVTSAYHLPYEAEVNTSDGATTETWLQITTDGNHNTIIYWPNEHH